MESIEELIASVATPGGSIIPILSGAGGATADERPLAISRAIRIASSRRLRAGPFPVVGYRLSSHDSIMPTLW
jgi:hypothetical protein